MKRTRIKFMTIFVIYTTLVLSGFRGNGDEYLAENEETSVISEIEGNELQDEEQQAIEQKTSKTIEIDEETILGYISGFDDIAVVEGSEDIDLLSLVSFDETIIESIEISEDELSYKEEGEYTATYHVSVNTDELTEVLVDAENSLDYVKALSNSVTVGETIDIEPAEFEFYQQIYVISEEAIEEFQNENPDITVYTTGMELSNAP